MTDLEYIDGYFGGALSSTDKLAFEQRLENDNVFAEQVTFYVHTKAIEREKVLKQKHEQWNKQPKAGNITIRLVSGIAASILIALSIWWYIGSQKSQSIQQLADNYVEANLMQLPQKMGADETQMEQGKNYYNKKQYAEAEKIFEPLAAQNPQALEFLGLSYFQQKQYNKAEQVFKKLTETPDLLENRGKFYLAITMLKNGQKTTAERLIKEIEAQKLFGAGVFVEK